jgi:hypothetical protein
MIGDENEPIGGLERRSLRIGYCHLAFGFLEATRQLLVLVIGCGKTRWGICRHTFCFVSGSTSHIFPAPLIANGEHQHRSGREYGKTIRWEKGCGSMTVMGCRLIQALQRYVVRGQGNAGMCSVAPGGLNARGVGLPSCTSGSLIRLILVFVYDFADVSSCTCPRTLAKYIIFTLP